MMKSSMLLLSVLFLSAFSCQDELAQKDVPEPVVAGLAATFPEASQVEWEKEGDNYEAEFMLNSLEHEALLNASGSVLKYKHELAVPDLPEAVAAAIQQHYPDRQISDPEKLHQEDQMYYQVELENESEEIKLVFAENGQEQKEAVYWD
ncbi:PepSY-like domain-containing protein [Cesiribacter andamanensis]|uniref:Putative beta-lactamase-inhibitor-like PepSY-like domain-containing protein n=1 Tax=Cesiribacter andamanensis AMV16 TaxID=1279009 RepID=M7NR88_9BACT|nr:PepSY-like domain-containing protein [Cesiribacter andamanensis]EMR01034.1 hypothetical protein ADICEAN_03846 [Cesiribacter andamanensis AMV16]